MLNIEISRLVQCAAWCEVDDDDVVNRIHEWEGSPWDTGKNTLVIALPSRAP
jgi:hypothetical protein